ncbi:MAG: Asp-tRNA(Asn)/Glu-tRNA(Gln) amidotransferase subunit GatC [Planctomycetota bacterium]|jgi:aspartyl-tRNA(Asn)/glutamyl-tRNA(Gln) amidotransferase subunit C
MAEPLSMRQVRHVASLARLRLSDDELEQYRRELTTILDHIATLETLDVEGVEPMAHPAGATDRLDDDEVAPPLPTADLLANAPAAEGDLLAVPKILGDEGGA